MVNSQSVDWLKVVPVYLKAQSTELVNLEDRSVIAARAAFKY